MKLLSTRLWTCFFIGVCATTLPAHAQLVDSSLPIEMEADATGADARTGTVSFTNISIRQGPLSILANSAESSTLDFDDSTWTFQGNVRLSAPGSELEAGRMTLRFVSKRISRATLSGSPLRYTGSAESGTEVVARSANVAFARNSISSVELEGTPIELNRAASDENKRMQGKANSMTYNADTDNLELTGDAELGEGANLITGNQITYNLSTRQVLAAANELGEGRVHITINPSSDDESSPDNADGQPDSSELEASEEDNPVPPESPESSGNE